MSTLQTALQSGVMVDGGWRTWAQRHPLTAYFGLTYGVTWLFFVPILLSPRAWDLLPFAFPDWLSLVFFILATYCGPLLAGIGMTGLTEGRAGVYQLFRRIRQWRFGVQWYLLILLGYPLVFLIGLSVTQGVTTWRAVSQHWSLFYTFYLPAILIGLLIPALGEETGWRGFALPRMQARYGALIGTLILGSLHALWHLPAYFVPGAILPGAFDLHVFLINSVAIVLSSLLWTWVFNQTGGSVFSAILLHATSNANSALIPQLVTEPADAWYSAKVLAVCVVIVLILSKGQLGYKADRTLS